LPAASSCSFNPPSLTTSGNVTMTVTTTARGVAIPGPGPSNRNPWLLLGFLSLAAMAGLSLRLRPQTRRLRRLVPILAACAIFAAGIMAGCGGGGGGTTTISNTTTGTPAGTYVITFTATSPNGSVNRTMNLTVR
jgi:hypothetical protein